MAEGGDSQEVGRRGWKRSEAMKGMIYQRIKTYEMGLFCVESPRQVRGWYEPQPGISPRRGGRGLKGSCVFCPSVGLQDGLNRLVCDQ